MNVGERLLGVRLTGDGAHYSHGDGVLQAFGTADGKDELANAGALLRGEGERGEIFFLDLQ